MKSSKTSNHSTSLMINSSVNQRISNDQSRNNRSSEYQREKSTSPVRNLHITSMRDNVRKNSNLEQRVGGNTSSTNLRSSFTLTNSSSCRPVLPSSPPVALCNHIERTVKSGKASDNSTPYSSDDESNLEIEEFESKDSERDRSLTLLLKENEELSQRFNNQLFINKDILEENKHLEEHAGSIPDFSEFDSNTVQAESFSSANQGEENIHIFDALCTVKGHALAQAFRRNASLRLELDKQLINNRNLTRRNLTLQVNAGVERQLSNIAAATREIGTDAWSAVQHPGHDHHHGEPILNDVFLGENLPTQNRRL